jgi:uncharacterized phiE125 gp8 family phage protein
MGLVQVTPPTLEPLTLAEVRAHLRLDASDVEPAPDAPTVALAGAGAGGVTAGAHRYRVTFVTADGETDGGTVSSIVTVADAAVNGKVAVSAIPVGGAAVTARKLYRTAAAGTTYLLLATIADNTTTTYTDTTADGSLGVGVPATNTTGDPTLSALIVTAREYVEMVTRRALLRQSWRLTLDCFPWCDTISLPRPPLISVESITYVDTAGATQTMSAADYAVDLTGLVGRVMLNYGLYWPTARPQRNAVTINFTAGFGSAASSVPRSIGQAMKLLVGHWYTNREVVSLGRAVADIPMGVDALLWSQRVLEAA